MKLKNIIKVGVATIVAVTGFSSCSDFLTIYPTDKTIGEDFWKSKEDVQEMVAGAYKSMCSYDCQTRAIIWGAFRSDELVKYSNYNDAGLDNINVVNLLPTNGYNNWAAFYSVINRCNIVLNHAPHVMEIDPVFTGGDYQITRAQMLALRSLCYFYLVRTFRDVPYTTQSYEDDDQFMTIPQTCPDSVLQFCIRDLEEAEQGIMKSGSYGDWRDKGYFTRDAVNSLLADIYLWRGSMTKSQSDYQKCIEYADKVINSKDAYFKATSSDFSSGSGEIDPYHLLKGDMAMYQIFTIGNSRESILEWQYDGTNNSNTGLENMYYESGSSDSHATTSVLMASQIFNYFADNSNTIQGQKVFTTTHDLRYWNNTYGVNNNEATELSIRKMVNNSYSPVPTNSTVGEQKNNSRGFDYFAQNWIVYRLTDVMLMKAEALVQTASSDSDKVALNQAYDIVNVINQRSLNEGKRDADTLHIDNYPNKETMELLVLAERERELCYEGKRWFDLVRFCYRHMDGVDIKKKMADQTSWPALYKPMIRLITRKYLSGGEAVSAKMKTEPYLYWPVLESEIRVNKNLQQNPVYELDKTTSKN